MDDSIGRKRSDAQVEAREISESETELLLKHWSPPRSVDHRSVASIGSVNDTFVASSGTSEAGSAVCHLVYPPREENEALALSEANQALAVSALLALKDSIKDSSKKTNRCPISVTASKQNSTQFPSPTTAFKQNYTQTQKHQQVAKRSKKREKPSRTKKTEKPKVTRKKQFRTLMKGPLGEEYRLQLAEEEKLAMRLPFSFLPFYV